MKRIATNEEIREYRLAHLWSDTLDQIFDMRDHYRPVPASKVARMIDKAFREYCELKPTAFEEFRALAEEADYPLSYYLHRVSDEIKGNPELKKKIAYSYRKEMRQKAAQGKFGK